MALSFKEKRELQRIIATKQADLASGGMKFKEKREAQKAMAEALSKLNAKVDAGGTSSLLDQLIKGDFNNFSPVEFITKLREVVDSIDGDVQPIKPGVISYVEYQAEQGNIILESAMADIFA